MRLIGRRNSHRFTVVAVAGLAVGALVLGLHNPATGAEPSSRSGRGEESARPASGGWERYVAESFTRGRGELCPFRLRSQVRFDREFVRTTRTFADGSPRRQEYVGPLVVWLKNLDSGRAVTRDLSARGIAIYRRDGSYDFRLLGPAAVGFYPGDSLRPGYYVLGGAHVVRFRADGSRRLIFDHGTEENLCRTLSGARSR